MIRSKVRYYFDRWSYNLGLEGPRSLYDCYREPSERKEEIWRRLTQRVTYEHNNLSVITYNAQFFTAGYLSKEQNDIFFNVVTSCDSGKLLLGPNELIELERQRIKYE